MASQVITVPELAAALRADPHGTTLLDVRWALGRSDGHEEYLAGHLPGAAYVDLETALAGPRGDGSFADDQSTNGGQFRISYFF